MMECMRGADGLDLLVLICGVAMVWTFWPRRRRVVPKPECYGDWPHYHPQDAAERDCRHCLHGHDCFEETPYHPRRPRVPPPSPPGTKPPARPTR